MPVDWQQQKLHNASFVLDEISFSANKHWIDLLSHWPLVCLKNSFWNLLFHQHWVLMCAAFCWSFGKLFPELKVLGKQRQGRFNVNLVSDFFLSSYLRIYFSVILERGGKRKRERERQKPRWCVASHSFPNGIKPCNLLMCLDWELNQWPFSALDDL